MLMGCILRRRCANYFRGGRDRLRETPEAGFAQCGVRFAKADDAFRASGITSGRDHRADAITARTRSPRGRDHARARTGTRRRGSSQADQAGADEARADQTRMLSDSTAAAVK
ncbi:hypothetical protein Ahu01nite_007520 [Winogradskya humida]|uniref:Uncharacterized protein n=1 Tax=Winogradskya humida TaxID=113566 RepID=A0ABQ3ZGG5_9ACTN|nr:hypothetical protein Ahu01nite_007520 [Actinoplanes humidus]